MQEHRRYGAFRRRRKANQVVQPAVVEPAAQLLTVEVAGPAGDPREMLRRGHLRHLRRHPAEKPHPREQHRQLVGLGLRRQLPLDRLPSLFDLAPALVDTLHRRRVGRGQPGWDRQDARLQAPHRFVEQLDLGGWPDGEHEVALIGLGLVQQHRWADGERPGLRRQRIEPRRDDRPRLRQLLQVRQRAARCRGQPVAYQHERIVFAIQRLAFGDQRFGFLRPAAQPLDAVRRHTQVRRRTIAVGRLRGWPERRISLGEFGVFLQHGVDLFERFRLRHVAVGFELHHAAAGQAVEDAAEVVTARQQFEPFRGDGPHCRVSAGRAATASRISPARRWIMSRLTSPMCPSSASIVRGLRRSSAVNCRSRPPCQSA